MATKATASARRRALPDRGFGCRSFTLRDRIMGIPLLAPL
jgi:hypothetical protein